tara:strand:- start:1033 stop:2007 length:975 start_codon:yes stop_codon:yes gene_type:complete
MTFDEKKIKTLSLIGQRAVLGTCLFEIENDFKNLIVLSADTSTSAGLDKFRKIKKNKYIEMGISEQNMISVAAGLSSENFNVLTTTFSPFQTLRCLEQIKVNISYMNFKVTMVGLASGVVLGNLGYTHCSIEDIGVISSIPNINIISPADGLETYKSIEACLKSDKSTYIRLTGKAPSNKVYEKDYEFVIGKSNLVYEVGTDVAILTNGTMVFNSIEASKILKKVNINCSVFNFHTIRPLDTQKIEKIFNNFKHVFTVEEHNINNGFGSMIANETLKFKKKINLNKIGLKHEYSNSGEYEDMIKWNSLDINGLAKTIEYKINNG